MLYINRITSDPTQSLTVTGLPGIRVNLNLRFMPRIQTWVMGVSYGSFSAQGIAVRVAPNMLRQFRNNIPFGITCLRTDGLEPYQIDDFSAQRANLFLLDASDVAAVEAAFFQ